MKKAYKEVQKLQRKIDRTQVEIDNIKDGTYYKLYSKTDEYKHDLALALERLNNFKIALKTRLEILIIAAENEINEIKQR